MGICRWVLTWPRDQLVGFCPCVGHVMQGLDSPAVKFVLGNGVCQIVHKKEGKKCGNKM